MTTKPLTLKIGAHMLDLLNPDPGHIDLGAIDRALWCARRFSGNPRALVVRQHTWLVSRIARLMGEPAEVVQWCDYHDDHEGIIGDIPGPLKHYINHVMSMTALTSLDDIEVGLDRVIAAARGIAPPTEEARRIVHFYDKMAETLEWVFVIGEPQAEWNRPFERWLDPHTARAFAEEAKVLAPPRGTFI